MDEKRCSTCHETQPLSQFNVRRAAADGRQARCRTCSAAWYVTNRAAHKANVRRRNARVRRENQARMGAYLREHPCVDCGESDPRVLEFDHEGEVPKTANVGKLLADAHAWERIAAEIAACSVRCANCHRRITSERAQDWRHRFAAVAHSEQAQAAADRLARVLG